MVEVKKITTADGSSSLYRQDIDETYHSRHGAIQEAMHVFLGMGLEKIAKTHTSINILEVGFGTGLNALLTAIAAKNFALTVNYLTLETLPLSKTQLTGMTYGQLDADIFDAIHVVPWEESQLITDNFVLTKKEVEIQTVEIEPNSIDLIYFDAFGPRAQPDMWTKGVFRKLHAFLKEKGIVVTYCAKGQVRRDMEEVGFTMERLPGPPGKREMLRGTK